MSAIIRPVMDPDDVFVPDENEVLHTRGVLEYDAIMEPEATPEQARADELANNLLASAVPQRQVQGPTSHKLAGEDEPHGMYWDKDRHGVLLLRPHPWFIADVAKTAELAMLKGMRKCGDDDKAVIRDMARGLRDYIECRHAINQMAGPRKLKCEADDACYQLAQAAKFSIDAAELSKSLQERGFNPDNSDKIKKLLGDAEKAAKEGYMIAQAVIIAADKPPLFDLQNASRRVVDYSCRKLTDWYAARREREANRDSDRALGAAIDLQRFWEK